MEIQYSARLKGNLAALKSVSSDMCMLLGSIRESITAPCHSAYYSHSGLWGQCSCHPSGSLACGCRANEWDSTCLVHHLYPDNVCFLGTGAMFPFSNTKQRKKEKEKVNGSCIFKVEFHISVLL